MLAAWRFTGGRKSAGDGVVEGEDEFFRVDMYLRQRGLFIVFDEPHGVADVAVVEVDRCVFFKTGICVVDGTERGEVDMGLIDGAAQALLHGFGFAGGVAGGGALAGDSCEQLLEARGHAGMAREPVDDVQEILGAGGTGDAQLLQQGGALLGGSGGWRRCGHRLRREAGQGALEVLGEGFQPQVLADVPDDADNFIAVQGFGDVVVHALFVGFADEVFALDL